MNVNTVGKLIQMYNAGIFNIEISEDGKSATLGGRPITLAEAEVLCQQFGWESWKMSPYVIIDKTRKFIKGIKNHIINESALNTYVDFKNNYTSVHGKFCDRIHFSNPIKGVEKSVIYNMPNNRWKYTVFEKNSIPSCGFTTLKKMAEYVNTTF